MVKVIKRIAHNATQLINSGSRILNYVGIGALLVMMSLTVGDVFLRYFFNRPVLGNVELTEYLMLTVGFSGMAWCAANSGHIRVDLVVSFLPSRIQAIVDSVTCIFSIAVFCLITWQAALELRDVWLDGRSSTILKVPAYPFYFMIAIGSGMLCLVLMTKLVGLMSKAVKNES